MNELIHIRGLEKTYISKSEKLTVLNNLDFSLEKGKNAVIIGESGSGKSTFLNILGGLDSATAGTVRAGDYVVSSLNEERLAGYRSRFLGFVFQFHYLLKDFTALENVFLPAYMAGISRKTAMAKALKLLDDVGLSGRTDHLPSELSGGERQRVAVARSLINDPELILADEPTGNLDPVNAVMIGDLLFSMTERYKKTLVLVTHDRNLAEKGEAVYSIRDGHLEVENGSAAVCPGVFDR